MNHFEFHPKGCDQGVCVASRRAGKRLRTRSGVVNDVPSQRVARILLPVESKREIMNKIAFFSGSHLLAATATVALLLGAGVTEIGPPPASQGAPLAVTLATNSSPLYASPDPPEWKERCKLWAKMALQGTPPTGLGSIAAKGLITAAHCAYEYHKRDQTAILQSPGWEEAPVVIVPVPAPSGGQVVEHTPPPTGTNRLGNEVSAEQIEGMIGILAEMDAQVK